MNTFSTPTPPRSPARAAATALVIALSTLLAIPAAEAQTVQAPTVQAQTVQAQTADAEAALAQLAGRWTNPQDDTVLDLHACADDAATLCVRLLQDSRSAGRSSRAGQLLAQHLAWRAGGKWQGQFIGPQGERFPLTLATTAPGRFEFQVCPLPFACDRGAYQRP